MIALVMYGCTAPVLGLVKNNNANMAKLRTGMATEQVLKVMEPADKTDALAKAMIKKNPKLLQKEK